VMTRVNRCAMHQMGSAFPNPFNRNKPQQHNWVHRQEFAELTILHASNDTVKALHPYVQTSLEYFPSLRPRQSPLPLSAGVFVLRHLDDAARAGLG